MQKINLVMVNRYHQRTVWTFEDTMKTLQNTLLQAGYAAEINANFVDPDPAVTNILFGVGSAFSHSYEEIGALALPRNVIIFNGEQLASGSALITDEYLQFLSRYIVFDCWEANLRDIEHRIKLRAFEMPLFPTPAMGKTTRTDWQIQYDVAFYGSLNDRRQKLFDEMLDAGVRIKVIQNVWGDALPDHLLDCRYVINMHAYDTNHLELNRCIRPLSMGVPVISEVSTLPVIGEWQDSGILFIPTEGFGRAVKEIIDAPPEVHMTAARKSMQFTNRAANAAHVRETMQRVIAELALMS